jgi:hypothetical protein|nr:MAG TPA: hypothetical protein [Caudoviricetes sp.]
MKKIDWSKLIVWIVLLAISLGFWVLVFRFWFVAAIVIGIIVAFIRKELK